MDTYTYYPDNMRKSKVESINLYRYYGEYFDAETGFTYLRVRYYEAKIGRFISEGPALDRLNWHMYFGGWGYQKNFRCI